MNLRSADNMPPNESRISLDKPAKWQGTSYAGAIRGQDISSRPYLVWGHGAHTYQRAVRTRDHLYIRTYHPGCFRAEWESLFDVTKDPYLTQNLIDCEPAVADSMRARLAEWWNFYAGTPGALPDPMQGSLQAGPTLYNEPGRYLQHLKDTGRGHLAEDLEARLHPHNGATHVSWHAQVPLADGDRAAMRRRFAAHLAQQT